MGAGLSRRILGSFLGLCVTHGSAPVFCSLFHWFWSVLLIENGLLHRDLRACGCPPAPQVPLPPHTRTRHRLPRLRSQTAVLRPRRGCGQPAVADSLRSRMLLCGPGGGCRLSPQKTALTICQVSGFPSRGENSRTFSTLSVAHGRVSRNSTVRRTQMASGLL